MSLRLYRTLQTLLLGALGLFLLQKVWAGTLFWYINQRFFVLVLAAGLGFLALAQSVFQASRRGATESAHDHSHDHDHDHTHAAPALGPLLMVAVPLAMGLLIPARPLGSTAIANKGINASAPLAAGQTNASVKLDLAPTSRTILDWVRAFNFESDPTVFDGQPADVIGFVYHDSRLPEGRFLVSRFTVSCCVADAMAIGMAVIWPQAGQLADNSWVRVRGAVQATHFNGQPLPLITADAVDAVAEPDLPYLYP